MAGTAIAAEEGGFSTFTLMDHWFQMELFGASLDPMLEGYSSLGFLAGQTQCITLSLMVTGVIHRHPGLLAKIVTTLDVPSRGSAMLGMGGAWYEREHKGLGVPFPPLRERFERLEETLQICLDDTDAFLTTMQEYADLGVDLVEVMPISPDPVAFVSELGERVVPRSAEIGTP